MENVQNKTAMVIGGASGIGYSIAEELLNKDAKQVAIIDLPIPRSEKNIVTLQDKFGKKNVVFFPCDITKIEVFEKTFEKVTATLDGLDILVNSAGILKDCDIEQTFAVNVIALIRSSVLALNYMGKHKNGKGGTILNIASISGLIPIPNVLVYSASKHAVIGFCRSLGVLYDNTNVRVLTVCPNMTSTPMVNTYNQNDNLIDQSIIPDEFVSWDCVIQTATHVANAVIEIIQKSENGKIWVVENGQPAFDIEIQPFVRASSEHLNNEEKVELKSNTK